MAVSSGPFYTIDLNSGNSSGEVSDNLGFNDSAHRNPSPTMPDEDSVYNTIEIMASFLQASAPIAAGGGEEGLFYTIDLNSEPAAQSAQAADSLVFRTLEHFDLALIDPMLAGILDPANLV